MWRVATVALDRQMRHRPVRTGALPERPWVSVGSDLFEFKGRDYLVMVDYYSRWIDVVELGGKTSGEVANKTKGVTAR